MPSPKRILIIKPSSLGDVVHALPVLAALRNAYPDAHIAWLVGNTFAPLLDGHPMLNEVIRFDRTRYGKMWRSPRAFLAFWRFVAQIRRQRFDLVVDLQGLIRSGLLSLFSGASRRVGFADAREGAWLFYNRRVRPPASIEHAVDKNLCLLDALGAARIAPRFPLGLRSDECTAARAMLAEAAGGELAQFIAVIPGARWSTKQWRGDRIGELIDRIHDDDMPRCVLLGGPDDRAIADQVIANCQSGVLDLVGRTTLRQLVALIDLSERVICHDSGPMHIAAALGKPTLAIFGPTNPRRTGPYSDVAETVGHPVECAPCYRRECPYGHHDCMEKLDVDVVFERLSRNSPPHNEVRGVL